MHLFAYSPPPRRRGDLPYKDEAKLKFFPTVFLWVTDRPMYKR